MTVNILVGDCRDVLREMPEASVQCCVTSPPYFGLRDYGCDGQIGLEQTPEAFVAEMVAVFREVKRVLRDDAICWINLGDSYASASKGSNNNGEGGSTLTSGARPHVRAAYNDGRGRNSYKVDCGVPEKNLIGIPWMVAFALRADGWFLRSEIIWHKPNPMPESVTDRCTKAHEQVFMLTKKARYFFDAAAIAEQGTGIGCGNTGPTKAGLAHEAGDDLMRYSRNLHKIAPAETRNRRSVWTIASQPFSGAHFATMPPDLAEICIKAGSRPGDMILDPFGGAGTTSLVADRLQRNATIIELNPAYAAMARERINGETPLFAAAAE